MSPIALSREFDSGNGGRCCCLSLGNRADRCERQDKGGTGGKNVVGQADHIVSLSVAHCYSICLL